MYSYSEAVDKVLEVRDRVGGSMPLQEDYENLEERGVLNIDDLVDALGVRNNMQFNHTRAYAAINIEVIRELRRRNARALGIAVERRVADPLSANLRYLAKEKSDPEGAARVKEANKNRAKAIEEQLWTRKKVAETIMRFYDQYGQTPTYEDVCRGGLFAEMDGPTPSNRTIYKYLGTNRSGWIDICKRILKMT